MPVTPELRARFVEIAAWSRDHLLIQNYATDAPHGVGEALGQRRARPETEQTDATERRSSGASLSLQRGLKKAVHVCACRANSDWETGSE